MPNDHYVPQFILRNWRAEGDNGKYPTLDTLNVESGIVESISTKKLFCAIGYDGWLEDNSETRKAIGSIERRFSIALSKYSQHGEPPPWTAFDWSVARWFCALQYARSPRLRRGILQYIEIPSVRRAIAAEHPDEDPMTIPLIEASYSDMLMTIAEYVHDHLTSYTSYFSYDPQGGFGIGSSPLSFDDDKKTVIVPILGHSKTLRFHLTVSPFLVLSFVSISVRQREMNRQEELVRMMDVVEENIDRLGVIESAKQFNLIHNIHGKNHDMMMFRYVDKVIAASSRFVDGHNQMQLMATDRYFVLPPLAGCPVP